MEEFLSNLYANSSAPALSALLLGLMTAISPCPMATNITAIGFIGKDIDHKNRVFYNGLIYTLGRTFAYTLLAIILVLGADQFKISGLFQQYGQKIIGPLMLIIGILMLGIIRFNFPAFSKLSERIKNKTRRTYWDVFLLGVIFALAFCPYSGVLYFRHAYSPHNEHSIRVISPRNFCDSNRDTGHLICLADSLYCIRNRICLQKNQGF